MNLINQKYIRFLNFKCLENNKDYSILSTFDTITRVKSNQDNRVKEFTILELKKRFKNVKELPAGSIQLHAKSNKRTQKNNSTTTNRRR